jgi:hypothetical protein
MTQKSETIPSHLLELAFAGPRELDTAIQHLQHIKSLREQLVEATQTFFGTKGDVAPGLGSTPAGSKTRCPESVQSPAPSRPLRRSRGKFPRAGSVRETVYRLLAGGISERRMIIPQIAATHNVAINHAENLADSILTNSRDPYIRRVAVGVYRLRQAKRFMSASKAVPSAIAAADPAQTPTEETQVQVQAA